MRGFHRLRERSRQNDYCSDQCKREGEEPSSITTCLTPGFLAALLEPFPGIPECLSHLVALLAGSGH